MTGRRAAAPGIAAVVAVLAALVASAARAHLPVGDRGLAGLCTRSSAVLVGRALARTTEGAGAGAAARTPFLVELVVHGEPLAAGTRIKLLGSGAPSRYAEHERAVLFVVRDRPGGSSWRAVQRSGGRLVLEEGEALDGRAAGALARLCDAARLEVGMASTRQPPAGAAASTAASVAPTAATEALVELLEAPVESLRLSAALDLLERAHHPELFGPGARLRLAERSATGAGDPRIAALATSIVARLAAGKP